MRPGTSKQIVLGSKNLLNQCALDFMYASLILHECFVYTCFAMFIQVSLRFPWRLHVLFVFLLMKKVLNGRQGLFFAILLSKFHVGLLDRKFALERAWYAFWSSFFPHSMKMFRLSMFPFSGSHIVILGIACLCRRVLQSRIIALFGESGRDGTCAFNAVLVFFVSFVHSLWFAIRLPSQLHNWQHASPR